MLQLGNRGDSRVEGVVIYKKGGIDSSDGEGGEA